MLIFPLKKQWYEKIKSEKTIEYREVKPYWTTRFYNEFVFFWEQMPKSKRKVPCLLRLGYTNKYMRANIVDVEVLNGKDTDLAIDKPVYAIHLADVREDKNDR